jgi:hypothetical protein
MVVKGSWDWPLGYKVISRLVFTFDDEEYQDLKQTSQIYDHPRRFLHRGDTKNDFKIQQLAIATGSNLVDQLRSYYSSNSFKSSELSII